MPQLNGGKVDRTSWLNSRNNEDFQRRMGIATHTFCHPLNQDVRIDINFLPIDATGAVYVMLCENESCRSSACQLPWTPSNMAGGKRNNLMSQVALRLYFLTYGLHMDV